MNVLIESTSFNFMDHKGYNKFCSISKKKSIGNTLMMDSDINKNWILKDD